MGLEPGRMLGGFRLIEKIGEGGMGVVWKALDTSLDRTVAIKVLPDAFAADSERMVRFEREAKLLASLDHPGIATIHGFHHLDGIRFIAMEHVEGVDLAHRIARGPLPIEEALDVGLQVASALEAAHDSGVVHRDLKPANILVGADGRTRILDFGLAKALETDASSSGSLSPTLTTPATRAGVVMGTAAYMSPEQAKGKPVDRRADVWAFGCVLYEALTGRRPFSGDGVSEILASVIMSPVDLQRLPAGVPEPVRRILKRCLEKDPKRRLRDIGEARFALEETLAGRPEGLTDASQPAAAPRGRSLILLLMTAIVAAAATWILLRQLQEPAAEPRVRRFEIPTSRPLATEMAAISPDGSRVAYLDGQSLRIRPLDRLEAVAIETEIPSFIFWSPDSRWLAWVSDGKIWKVAAEGGARAAIADFEGDFTGGEGASWGADDRIIVSRGDGDLYQVSARGGDLTVLLALDETKEGDFHEPHVLPDGSVLFVTHVASGRPDTLELLADDRRRVLLRIEGQDIWHPVYSPSGHILYRRQPTNPGIWALPFSLADRKVKGEPFLVVPDGNVPSISTDGTLVHVTGSTSRMTQIVRAARDGSIVGTIGRAQEDQWPFPALSPDGRSVAIDATENEADEIWIHDIERGTVTRLTFADRHASGPGWSPDGSMLVYQEGSSLPFTLMLLATDGTSEPRAMGTGHRASWSPDGRMILYAAQVEGTDWDLYYRDIAEGAEPVRFLKAAESQAAPQLSPDGKYVAYMSHETGQDEIYIKGFPGGEGKWQVSSDGGHWPRWSRSGGRLYYAAEETIMEVDVQTAGSLKLGAPRALFTRPELGWPLIFGWPPGFDVTADDREFIFCQPVEKVRDRGSIVVVENWAAGVD